jgi:hypothetical protein
MWSGNDRLLALRKARKYVSTYSVTVGGGPGGSWKISSDSSHRGLHQARVVE